MLQFMPAKRSRNNRSSGALLSSRDGLLSLDELALERWLRACLRPHGGEAVWTGWAAAGGLALGLGLGSCSAGEGEHGVGITVCAVACMLGRRWKSFGLVRGLEPVC